MNIIVYSHQAVCCLFDLCDKEIGRRRTDEFCDKSGRTVLIYLHGRADLLDPALVHDDDSVCKAHGLRLVMSNENAGGILLDMDILQLGSHRHTELCIQVGQRFVHQEDLRLYNDRPGYGNPLSLTARHLRRITV